MNRKARTQPHVFVRKIRIVFGFLVLIAIVLLANLFYIQVIYGDDYRRRADNQYISSDAHIFDRGNILMTYRDGTTVTGATQVSGYKAAINPQDVFDHDALYEQISKYVELDYQSFVDATYAPGTYREVIHELDKETAVELREGVGSAIQLYEEKWRTYPLEDSASQSLGIVSYRGDDITGTYGLERFYQDTLSREGGEVYGNFFAEVFGGVKEVISDGYIPEGDITTSLDPRIQLFLETQLDSIDDQWNSALTGGIVVDPQTGDVVALSATPRFDANNFQVANPNSLKNPLVENVYEMGSTMKPLVMAMGLDSGVVTADTTYYDAGSVDVGKHTIYNFDKKGRGTVSLQEALNQSLNTAMVYISRKINKDNYRDYFKKYGFGTKTGVDLPNEVAGLTSNLKSNRDIEFANMSFGQGIAISPIAMVKALSALANEGVPSTPHLVQKIRYTNGLSDTITPEILDPVMSPESAGEISRMLVNVFDNYRNGDAKLPHHSIAAKTGTAQIPNTEGAYYDDRNLHSFFGYFPAYDPEYLVFLFTVHPKQVRYASETLVDPFLETAKFLINYSDIAPDR